MHERHENLAGWAMPYDLCIYQLLVCEHTAPYIYPSLCLLRSLACFKNPRFALR